MKNLLLILSMFILVVSCKKQEDPEPIKPTITKSGDTTEVFGKTWKLVDAKVYLQNLETSDDNTYYDHFNSNKTSSNLNPFNPIEDDFHNISLLNTTWEFGESGFILNGGQSFKYLEVSKEVYNIQINGTSRNVTLHIKQNGVVIFKVLESFVSIDNENHSFFNYLTFIEDGVPTQWDELDPPVGYTYGGVIQSSVADYKLNGTKWVITRVQTGISNEFPNDTLEFSISTYKWTSSTTGNTTNEKYTLNRLIGNNTSDLTLYGNPTIGGDYSGSVPNNFVDVGEFNGVTFVDVFDVNNNKKVWAVKIN